jgi:hypothetical protein
MHPVTAGHTRELFPLGIRTVVHADDAGLLRAAAAAYAAWVEPPAGPVEPASPVTIRLSLGPSASVRGAVDVRVSGHRLAMAGAGVDGWADARLREAACVVPPDLAADPARLAAEVLDTLALFLLTRAGRVPLHAAAFVAGGTAVLLAGPSGSGKSTLALTAQGLGLGVLSDDTVYVQLRPAPRVWGFPRPIHVFPEQAPGSVDGDALRLRSGKLKAAVPLAPASAPYLFADRAVLVLLERGTRVSLDAISADEAVRRMAELLEPGFDHFREQLPDAVRACAGGGAFRLTLSRDPARAIRALLDSLGRAD